MALDDLRLRAATYADADALLRWRNDPESRAASFQQREVSRAEHGAWLERKLADPDTQLLVGTACGSPLGAVRLERAGDDVLEAHIVLAPEARGRGFAPALLSMAARECGARNGPARIRARVKSANVRSRRAFERAGFRKGSEREGVVLYELDVRRVGDDQD